MSTPLKRIEFLLQQYATYYFIKKERFELLDWIFNQNNDTSLQNKMEPVWQNTAVDYIVLGIYREKDFCHILNRIIPQEESKSIRLWNMGNSRRCNFDTGLRKYCLFKCRQ